MSDFGFKILNGGTPKTGTPLCRSCAHGARRVGQNMEDETFCSAYGFGNSIRGGPHKVTFAVAECSKYLAFNTADFYDMEKIAWSIQVRTRGVVGFQGTATEFEIVPPKGTV